MVGEGDYGESGAHTETRNVGVTFDLAVAETHAKSLDHDYETFIVGEIAKDDIQTLREEIQKLSDIFKVSC